MSRPEGENTEPARGPRRGGSGRASRGNPALRKALWIVGAVLLAAALGGALVVDLGRIGWERANRGIVAVVPADGLESAWGALASARVTAISVRASSLADGRGPPLAEVRGSGLAVALILDRPSSPSLADLGPFPLVLVQGPVAADDPLLVRLLDAGSTLVLPEFSDLRLARILWDAGYDRVVRAHEISPEDQALLSRDAILTRWNRAVRERGIRCLLLSPFPGRRGEETLDDYEDVLSRVEALGYRVGSLSPLPPRSSGSLGVLLHLGTCALLLLTSLLAFRGSALPALVAAVLALAGLALEGLFLRQVDAFLVSVLAPVFSFLVLLPRVRWGWRSGARMLLLSSLGSVAGGLLLAALLADPAFLVKLAEFRGVKASLLIPPLAGVVLFLREVGWPRIREALLASKRLPTAAGALLFLLAAGFLVLRSGNVDGLVLGFEERTRGLLEALLVARPRFKEFLLGHPLLLLFGGGRGPDLWRAPLLFFGLVGQASILNTFAHAHTPLLLSLLRTGNGLAAGLILGTALYGFVRVAEAAHRRFRPH